MVAEFLHAGGPTAGKTDMTQLIAPSAIFANAPKNKVSISVHKEVFL
jgi:hypothetical protein